MDFRPFRGLRPRPDLSARIPSPPYDVLTVEQGRSIAAREPHSFVRVTRPEVDFDPEIDPHDERVYARGRENFEAMLESGWLVRDPQPAFYMYRLEVAGHRQTGLLGAVAVRDYLENRIRRHEHTRPDKEQDRVRLGLATGAHLGPVLLAYRAVPGIEAAVEEVVASKPPAVRFRADDGVEHSLWVVLGAQGVDRFLQLFASVERAYVADGHHRAAAAARIGAELAACSTVPEGPLPARYFLAGLFPAGELRILGYHRVVRGVELPGTDELLGRLRASGFEVAPTPSNRGPTERGCFAMYLGRGRQFVLRAPPAVLSAPEPLERLDAWILEARILRPILGIEEPRSDARLDFVGGPRALETIEQRVDDEGWTVAFALYPTSIEDVMAVADAGAVLPPKSTWFEPKLRSGLVVQTLAGEEL